jgi:hypothetical protein
MEVRFVKNCVKAKAVAVLGIHDSRISGKLFGTKNHEMRGPPVLLTQIQKRPEFFLILAKLNKTKRGTE